MSSLLKYLINPNLDDVLRQCSFLNLLCTSFVYSTNHFCLLVFLLQDSLNFVTEVYRSVPIVCQLLCSKVSSDVQESIDFFVSGYEIGVSSCQAGIRKMLPLVWSKEQGIKDAVVAAYKRIYLVQNTTNPRYLNLIYLLHV